MRKLTLVRHAITSWNSSGKFQGHSDIPLSEEGLVQAERLAERLRGVTPDLVLSSPSVRALKTAQIVCPQADIKLDERLKELNFGVFEGLTQPENERHEAWATWFADPFKRAAPDGESYEELRTRAVSWLEALPKVKNIMAFSHSGTIRMLITHVLGVEHPKWRKRIFLNHSSLTVLLFRDDEIVVERVNDAQHLNGQANPFDD